MAEEASYEFVLSIVVELQKDRHILRFMAYDYVQKIEKEVVDKLHSNFF